MPPDNNTTIRSYSSSGRSSGRNIFLKCSLSVLPSILGCTLYPEPYTGLFSIPSITGVSLVQSTSRINSSFFHSLLDISSPFIKIVYCQHTLKQSGVSCPIRFHPKTCKLAIQQRDFSSVGSLEPLPRFHIKNRAKTC